MPLLNDEVRNQLKTAFTGLTTPVKLVVFTQEMECQYCRENRSLAEEIASTSDKLKVEVYNFAIDRTQVEHYGIERIPAIVVEGAKDYGIRFYGIPAGYEFASLIEAIRMVSSGDSGLAPATIERLKTLPAPLNLKVFVTPTCPYCPPQVHLAHRLAVARDGIKAEMIEAGEFPDLAHRFNVMGVPRTIVNDTHAFEGAMPEQLFIDKLAQALVPA